MHPFFFTLTFLFSLAASAQEFTTPKENFIKTFGSQKQIWVVGYANGTIEEAFNDLEESFNNGANAIVYESNNYKKLDDTLTQVRKKYPDKIIGVNFLGNDKNLMTYKETFQLAKKHQLQIAWTDFSAVDLIREAPETSLHDIESHKPENTFYVSGIHMKYSTLLDAKKPLEKSALQAMGWVDGLIITGPKTGVATDHIKAAKVRRVIGDYPLGAASGVDQDNIKKLAPHIDFILVNTSISDKNHRIIGAKVKALRDNFR